MAEQWKAVAGYEGLYEISNKGRVKSLVGWNGHKYIPREKILRTSTTSTGYFKVELSKNRQRKSFKVHRLVAYAFIPVVNGKRFVNHKDGNPKNNCMENLEWCTNRENVQHAVDTGLRKTLKLSKEQLVQLYYIETKNLREIAELYGVSTTAIAYYMKKHHIARRDKNEAKNKYHIDLQVLAEEIQQGKSNGELANKYGCPRDLIATRRYQLRKRGKTNG